VSPLGRLLADESGAALVEYVLVSAAFALASAAALAAIAHQCGVRLGATSTGLTALGTTPP
jgi:Flp pilus assembly pilin Flp